MITIRLKYVMKSLNVESHRKLDKYDPYIRFDYYWFRPCRPFPQLFMPSCARLDTLVIEKAMVSGGQVLTTYEVDNYPGLPGIGGYDLGLKLREHADKLGARFAEDEVQSVEDKGPGQTKVVHGFGGTYEAKALILATGAIHRKLGIPGEETLAGAGVSYCATCDGAFFRNKVTAVIGGGDVAVEDAELFSPHVQQGLMSSTAEMS